MKFLILLLLVILGYSISGQAEGELDQKYEAAATPMFGYSTYNGLALGANLEFGYRFANRWQVVAAASHYGYTKSGHGSSDFSFGTQYNFSDDLRNASFVGIGWGSEQNYDSSRGPFAYLRFGYRVLLSEELGVSWSPMVGVEYSYSDGSRAGNNSTMIGINPLRFSMSF